MKNKFFYDRRIVFVYLFTIIILIVGTTYALQSGSSILGLTTAIVKIDETAYGSTTFDSSDLDIRPILDSKVETSEENVIKIDFTVGGAETNNNENIIYDISLNDLDVNCNLISPYMKWKLMKDGTEISSGSLDYTFDTIDENGRMVLTTIQEDLPDYNANQTGYDSYTFYMWLSDSCQNDDLSTCTTSVDQSSLLGQNFSGKVEVELYTESKKALVRNPGTIVTNSKCSGAYTVTLDAMGGTVSSEEFSVSEGGQYTELVTPTRTNTVSFESNGGTTATSQTITYTFEKWYLEKDYKTEVTNSTALAVNKNHTLYAKWSGTNAITLPTVTQDGYILVGWYLEEELKNKVGEAGDTYQVVADQTLYAKWRPTSYIITLNQNGGRNGTEKIYLVSGDGYYSDEELTNKITIIPQVPVKLGYDFTGYTNLTNKYGTITASNTAFTSDTVVNASWDLVEGQSYNVKFVDNLLSPSSSQTVGGLTAAYDSNGSYLTLNGTNTSTRISFQMLSVNNFVEGEQYELIVSYVSGSMSGDVDRSISAEVMINSSTYLTERLYADMSLPFIGENSNTFTVTSEAVSSGTLIDFHLLVASTNALTFTDYKIKITFSKVNYKKIEFGKAIGTLPALTKEGYTLDGWYTDLNGQGTKVTENTVLTDSNTKYYANWIPNTYKVTLDNQGATSAGTTEYYYQYNTTKTVNGIVNYYYSDVNLTTPLTNGTTITIPTRTGYIFGGYYTGANGTGTQYVNASGLTVNNRYTMIGDVTLYAKWTLASFAVVANPNGGTIPATTGWTAVTSRTTFTKTVTYGSNYGTLPTPTRTGYTFTGWSNVLDVGSVAMSASTNNWNYKAILTNVYPGMTYSISMTSATLNSGTATQFAVLIYDFTAQLALVSQYLSFGSNVSFKITCPTTATASNDIQILVYAGVNGSTANNATTYSGVKIGTTGTTSASTITADSTVSAMAIHTLFAQWSVNNYYVDLNWTLDGTNYSSPGITTACAYVYINGTSKGCKADFYEQYPHGTVYSINGISLNGSSTITYTYSGTVNGAALSHAIDIRTLSIVSGNTTYGSVSVASRLVKTGTTYTTSGATLTIGDGSSRTVTASATAATGYTTYFSSWSPSSGTINSATTVTANFGRYANNYQIGSGATYADTLANAVAKATTDGTTITVLTNNLTDSSSATVTHNLTLNTNGKTLTRTGYTDINGGTFTINGSGKIIRGTPTSCRYLFYMYAGNLSIGAVTISDSDTSSCATPLIENVGTGTITVNTGASVTSPRNTLKMSGSGGITLVGGTVEGTGDYNTIYAGGSSTGTITVSGGTVTHTGASDYAISTSATTTAPLKITSGTVSGTYYAINVGGTFTMSGGTVKITTTSTDTKYYAVKINTTATATITGGTLTSSSSGRVISNLGTLTVNGTTAYIYNSSSANGVGIRTEGTSGILQFAAGKSQATGGYGLYVLDSGTAYLNYASASGKGNAYGNGAYVSSKANHAIYGTTSASIYYGTLAYAGTNYAPTALVGAEGKYAFYCSSGVTTCDWRGGRLFSYELFYEMNSYVTDHSGTNAILYDEYTSTKSWDGGISGYALKYNVKAYYDA